MSQWIKRIIIKSPRFRVATTGVQSYQEFLDSPDEDRDRNDIFRSSLNLRNIFYS